MTLNGVTADRLQAYYVTVVEDRQWRHYGERGEGGPPRVTPSRGDTRKKLWTNSQRIVDKRGRTGKKGAG